MTTTMSSAATQRAGRREWTALAVLALPLLLVDGFARQHVLMALQFSDLEASAGWADQLRELIDPAAMPGLSQVLAAGAFDTGEPPGAPGGFPGDEFEFGLALVLDGIEALAITTGRSTGVPHPRR